MKSLIHISRHHENTSFPMTKESNKMAFTFFWPLEREWGRVGKLRSHIQPVTKIHIHTIVCTCMCDFLPVECLDVSGFIFIAATLLVRWCGNPPNASYQSSQLPLSHVRCDTLTFDDLFHWNMALYLAPMRSHLLRRWIVYAFTCNRDAM